MIKSILGGKSKNLFDISKVITSNVVKRNGNSLICSSYGTSIGTLGSICPTLKLSDTITVSFKCSSEGVASNFMSMSKTSGGLKIFRSGETFNVSEVGLSSTWYLYNTDWAHRDIPNKTTYSDIQVELGSTATEYVPHELTSYKSIMKVSDVCQLLDKSKYDPTHTVYGITWTNNGDGTITANGSVVSSAPYSSYLIYIPQFKEVKNNHKYTLFSGIDNINVAYVECMFWIGNSDGYFIKDCVETNYAGTFGFTITQGEYLLYQKIELRVRQGYTANNLVFKPQLFDLTEMFGAGNEPKTVAEFKAKFPNDYYPYSPSCFVTSFDERMPCKTKNLFSSSTEVGIPSSTKSDASEKRLLEDGKWYVGFSKNNYYRGPQSTFPGNFQYNIWENSISIYTDTNGYGLAKCVYVEPNTSYILSYKVSGAHLDVGVGFYQEDGTFIKYFAGKEITTPQNCKFITVVFAFSVSLNRVTNYFSNIQLVKGTTATDYVPYGYV